MNILRSIALVIFSLIILSGSCKKNNVQPQSELSKLPPATQTGANTFGCLVNGQAFLPGGPFLSSSRLQCNYIFTAGGYHFTVAANHKNQDGSITDIVFGTDSLAISEGQTLIFKISGSGNVDALFDLITITGNQNRYITTNTVSGQVTITKFDQTNQIVSGMFYFNAVNNAGDIVKVTDGRFDMRYTR
ncbi:MAG: DUF6252 family protein [Bacteroidota bacterium]|nr:DUF6252 family protein [Bacteroidota bacterium]